MPNSVLIIGANGRLGRVLASAFADAGWQVAAHVRREPGGHARPGVRFVRAALGDPAALAEEAGRADVVVHAANPPYTRWKRDSMLLAQGAVDTARRLSAVLMFPGNVYNFGARMPALLEEDTPQEPTARKGRLRVEVEQALRKAARAGLRVVVLRAGDFFGGPGRGAWFDRMLVKSLRSGRVVYPGRTDVVHAWAYLPDLARAFVMVAERRAALAQFDVLHFPGHGVTGAHMIECIGAAARRLGLIGAHARLQVGGTPWLVLRAGGLLVPMWREVAELRYLWYAPHRLSGERLAAFIGSVPHTPLELAVEQALRELFPR
ncbi:MAG TPA: NAD-dependent epimerase/dehydratase family protein [Burkholderiales bacterium]|jgi:nucleoside-diphosphate-sugar epimerase